MTLHTDPFHSILVELNFSSPGTVPDWIEVLPRGPAFNGFDGRKFRLPDPAGLVAAFNARNQPIVIDIDHVSETAKGGTPVPAMGWVEALELRDGSVWGRVKWTDAGLALMEAQAYRYVSPVVGISRATGEIVALTSVALVHRPNLALTALNFQQETDTMDPAILEALGLEKTASAADALTAITTLKTAQDKALNSQNPDREKFVPRADYELAMNRATDAEAQVAKALDVEMNAAVDDAIKAGKIAPVSRDYHLETCRALGLEKFTKMMAAQPAFAAAKSAPAKDPKTKTALNAEEIEVCKMFGTDPADHMAFAAKDKEA